MDSSSVHHQESSTVHTAVVCHTGYADCFRAGSECQIRQSKQATEAYQYRNTKEKLYETNMAIWYNKMYRDEFHPDPASKQSA